MAFTIPNSADAGFSDQSEPDKVDLDILSAGHDRTGVISGCAVTAQAIVDTTVAVASGVVAVAGTRATVTSGNVTIGVGGLTQPRFDLVVADNAGTKSKVTGTEAANPVFPAIPANSVVLAAVYVPALDLVINTNQITDKRVMLRDTHLLANGTALGPDHTISGANAGEVLRALSATTAAFDAIADADLPATITRDTEALLQALADAKGDLAVASAADTWARLAAGADNRILRAASGEATGLKWDGFHGCFVYRDTAQSMAKDTNILINMTQERYDTDGFHDTSTDNTRITIPSGLDGYYLAIGHGSWVANSNGTRILWIIHSGAGAITERPDLRMPATATLEAHLTESGIFNMVAGEYLELVQYHTSTTTPLNSASGGNSNPWLAVIYLGPA